MIRRIRNNCRLSGIGYRVSAKTKNRKPKTEFAFTLIELLITVTIFSAVSIVIYATFNSGMRIWRRVEKFNLADVRNLIKIEKLNKELRQSFIFKETEIVFSGKKNQIQFATVIDSEVNNVVYSFDSGSKTVLRGTAKLSDILAAKEKKEELSPNMFLYLSKVDEFSMSYFYYDVKKGAYLWKEEWKENILPAAVKFTMIFENEPYSTTIFIPSA